MPADTTIIELVINTTMKKKLGVFHMSLRVHTKQSNFLRLRRRFTPRNDTRNETCRI